MCGKFPVGTHLGSRCRPHRICMRQVLVWQKFLVTQSLSLPKKTRCVTVCVTMLGKASAFWTSPFQTSSSSYAFPPCAWQAVRSFWLHKAFLYPKETRCLTVLYWTELDCLPFQILCFAQHARDKNDWNYLQWKYLQRLRFLNFYLTAPFPGKSKVL